MRPPSSRPPSSSAAVRGPTSAPEPAPSRERSRPSSANAVERDRVALTKLRALADQTRSTSGEIVALKGDFTRPLDLPPLDGALIANALHFVSAVEQPGVLARIARGVRPGGQIVIVEYESRGPSRWVPYPVSLARLEEIARAAQLGAPVSLGTRPSEFGGTLYAAAMAVAIIP